MLLQIFNNTLLKLVARNGTDSERKSIILDSGEFGFTTDTERLFVGNGGTYGGVLTGNKFLGSGTDITTFSPGEIGDLAYNTDTKILYRIKQNEGSSITDWEAVGGKGLDSNTNQAGSGAVQITNIVRIPYTNWTSLSSTPDPNTFYIVANNNWIVING